MKHSSVPVVSPDGGQFAPQMLPILERQTLVQFTASSSNPDKNYHSFSLPGPEPGNWYIMGATTLGEGGQVRSGATLTRNTQGDLQGENRCSTEVTTRAEYILETNIITIIPVYNNYQDIRTFYTIQNQQTYK